MTATVFGVPASHPALAAELMLRHKGADYRRVDLVAGIHRPLLRLLGFRGITVPAIRLSDGVRLQGSRNISRALDVVYPGRPLFPADRREEVERAERWGDLVLQEVPRRLAWWVLRRRPAAVESYLADAKTGIPQSVAAPLIPLVVYMAGYLNGATDEAIRRDVAAIPGLLDRVDELIASGVIGGAELNAADFQIATSVRMMCSFDDLAESIGSRPAGEHARRVVPRFPGRTPAALPGV